MQDDIIKFLLARYPEFCREKEMVASLGLSASTVSEQLQYLVSKGRVRKEKTKGKWQFQLILSSSEELEIVVSRSPEILRKKGWTVLPKGLFQFSFRFALKLGVLLAAIGFLGSLEILRSFGVVPAIAVYVAAILVVAASLLIIVPAYLRRY
jgi:predicted transcriptional regulator